MQARQLLSHSCLDGTRLKWQSHGWKVERCWAVRFHWGSIGWELAQVPRGWRISSLEMFSSLPDMGLGTLLWVSLPEQRLGQMDPEVSSNLNHSVLHDNLIQGTAAFPAEPCELFMSSKNYLLSTNLAWASCYFFPGWWQCTHLVLPGSLLSGYHAHIYTHRTMFKH